MSQNLDEAHSVWQSEGMATDASNRFGSQSETGRSLLQDRIRLLAKVFFILSTVFLILPFLMVAVFRSFDMAIASQFDVRRLAQVALTLGMGLFWALAARVPMRTRSLHLVDAGIQATCTVAVGALVAGLSTGIAGALTLALSLGHFLVLRSVIVPSSGRRTFWMGTIVTTVAVCGFWTFGRLWPRTFAAEGASPDSAFLDLLIWMIFAVISSTIASRVIFGLREEVHKARTIGQYEIQRRLGEGGMGIVFEATHAMLRRRTAIKLIPPTKVDPTTLTRFEREVRQTARLTHPNTISVFDYGRTPDGIFYYAMELLEGVDLQGLVEEHGPLPPGRVIRILTQVLASLREAHGVGLIHRDIKPANIMLTERGGEADIVKVLDFGLVKEVEKEEATNLTATKALTGTPMYMSPEAILAPETVGAPSDLYTVAAVGYFLLTGSEVFRGASIVEVCAHHLHTEPQQPSERLGRGLPEDLSRLLLRGLSKSADDRPKSAETFRSALLSCDVEPWTDEDAAAWWDEHREALRRRAKREPMPSPETVEIDLGRR